MAISSGTYASIPGAPASGDLYLLTDSFYTALYYNGASWDHFIHGKKVTPPSSGDFSWVNQGTATISTTNGGIHMDAPVAGASTNNRLLVKAAPSTPYTVTAALITTMIGANYFNAGLCFRESASGKFVTAILAYSSFGTIMCNKYNSATSGAGDYVKLYAEQIAGAQLLWLRIQDDGTNRKSYYSCDGINFIQYHSVGRADFITANQVGWLLATNNATYGVKTTLVHWLEA